MASAINQQPPFLVGHDQHRIMTNKRSTTATPIEIRCTTLAMKVKKEKQPFRICCPLLWKQICLPTFGRISLDEKLVESKGAIEKNL
jgi:hypothetical protein